MSTEVIHNTSGIQRKKQVRLDIHIFGYFIAIFLNIAGFIQDYFITILYYFIYTLEFNIYI